MAPMLTPEDVVRRIAAECTFVDEPDAVGIRLEPAAAIVRQYGEQFRASRRQRRPRLAKPSALLSEYGGRKPAITRSRRHAPAASVAAGT
jgi:hypothetical protein